jgi:hypothetical protein
MAKTILRERIQRWIDFTQFETGKPPEYIPLHPDDIEAICTSSVWAKLNNLEWDDHHGFTYEGIPVVVIGARLR